MKTEEMLEFLTLKFNDQPIRVRDINGKPWWVAKDLLADVLGLRPDAVSERVAKLPASEKGSVTIATLGGPQELLIISHGGALDLISASRKPVAKALKRYMIYDVMAELTTKGFFVAPGAKPLVGDGVSPKETPLPPVADLAIEREKRQAAKEYRLGEVGRAKENRLAIAEQRKTLEVTLKAKRMRAQALKRAAKLIQKAGGDSMEVLRLELQAEQVLCDVEFPLPNGPMLQTPPAPYEPPLETGAPDGWLTFSDMAQMCGVHVQKIVEVATELRLSPTLTDKTGQQRLDPLKCEVILSQFGQTYRVGKARLTVLPRKGKR